MAASTSGALKAVIEGAGLGISAYRDEAPKNAIVPYAVVHEGLNNHPDADEDGVPVTTRELVQVDLYQPWKNADDTRAESLTLPRLLLLALASSRVPTHPQLVYQLAVDSSQRSVERDVEVLDPTDNKTLRFKGLVHHAITCRLMRQV